MGSTLSVTLFELWTFTYWSLQKKLPVYKMANGGGEPSWSMKLVISAIKKKWSNVPSMTTPDLHQLLSEDKQTGTQHAADAGTNVTGKMLLLDVRPTEEYNISHIDGAIRVDPEGSDVQESATLVTEQNTNSVVCYCSVGYRSSVYAQKLTDTLKEKDIKDVSVYNLEGSLMKWANEDRPMVDINGRPTIYCHPYSAMWGKLLRSELRLSNL